MSAASVHYEVVDHVAIIRLDRPSRRNAFDRTLVRGINDAIATFDADPDQRVAVIVSACDDFSVGVDLDDAVATLKELGTDDINAGSGQFSVDFEDREFNDKPIVAGISGLCYGSGLTMALACDLRVASSDSRFCLPEVKLGLGSVTGTFRSVRNMGHGNALELLLLAEPRSADWALRTGLVNEVVPPSDVETTALAWATTIAPMAPAAISGTRRVAHAAAGGTPFDEVLELGIEMRALCTLDTEYVASITGGESND